MQSIKDTFWMIENRYTRHARTAYELGKYTIKKVLVELQEQDLVLCCV
jgi:hypothetical protein